MKPMDWLKKATVQEKYPTRPVLTMGHTGAFLGDAVAFGSDAYRMHIHWSADYTPGQSILFPHSYDTAQEAAQKWAAKIEFETLLAAPVLAHLCVSPTALLAAVKPLKAFDNGHHAVRLTYQIGEGHLTLYAANPEHGDVTTQCPAQVCGRQIMQATVWVNRNYLADALKAFGKKDARISLFITRGGPLLVGIPDDRMAIIMPMH